MRQTMKNLWQAITENRSAVNGELKPPARAYSGSNGYIVYLTYGSQDDRSTITFGVHSDYAKAIQLAFEARPQHTPILSLKLDVVTRIRERSVPTTFQQQDERISFKPGRDGIILDDRPDMLFIPEEVQAYQILKRGRVNESGLRHALSYRPQTAAMESSIKTPANVRVIRTTSYYIDSSGYYSLSNGQRKGFPLSEEKLEYAVKLASSNYFKHAVDANGRITYAYHPHTDSEADGYNILRHAGTAYSMLELYEWNRDQDILDAAARALEYLTSFSHEHTINGIAVNVIVEEDLIKLGGNGLAIVACAKYTQVTGDRKYVPFMQSLATWMEELQRDAPRFSIHKQEYSTGKVWDFESRYYPGEAILAMVRLYETDGDSRWLDYAEKETRYLIEVRDREADKATIPHDHWLLYGIYNLYQYRPLAIYRSHAFFIADAITESQFTDPDEVSREMLGYFHMDNPRPRSTPAACRSEGLGAASRLADQVKDRDRARRYRRSIHQAISFQLQMQLYPESVLYFPNKSLSLGAFRGNLRNWELRNDYTQHNISSILSYLRFVKAMSTTEKSSLQLIQTSFDAEKYPVYLRRSNRRVFLACIRRGADWTRLDGGRFELKKGRYTYTIEDGKVLDALNSPLAVRCIKRKEVTTGLLRSRELPAPENALFMKGISNELGTGLKSFYRSL
ncbi:hypothetical protein [Alkalicoccus luteus]|uniref:D-glucuronyl C5-epimerase C-terminal domain-containing protein n=1 Tax=Alkalicoccus luteus TaxID=1237094 RepID=A0A969PPZ4_9BACI|nr:hypothetical protein [Alkalicoccus luteus]NJP37425.1 hypothetical protein [Alkalicoccus luteus]